MAPRQTLFYLFEVVAFYSAGIASTNVHVRQITEL